MTDLATPKTRGPYRNGIRRREQIVRSASEVFGQLGYTGGSIRTIAERVGVSPATLMQHFGSKEGLLIAVLDDWDEQTTKIMQTHTSSGLSFFRWLPELMEFHLQHRGLLELFLTMATEATHPDHPARPFVQQRYEHFLALARHHLREACDMGEIRPLTDDEIRAEVHILFAVLDGLELQWLLNPELDLRGLVATYVGQQIQRWQSQPSLAASGR